MKRIFEFGCSNCRVLRHYINLPEPLSLYGADIQVNKVLWAMENIPYLNLIVNTVAPPLPFPSGYFGLVYAMSVFTHLVDYHTAWIAELARITAPGGYAYLTFHDETATKIAIDNWTTEKTWSLHLIPDEKILEKLSRFDYDFLTCGSYYEGTSQAYTYMSRKYIEKISKDFFELIDVIPKAMGFQTVYLFRRKS
jgi:SAM-dependent methyltransferase